MIKQEKDRKWVAKCDICQWTTIKSEKKDAENKLSNHINIVHKRGIIGVEKQKLPISPGKLPPQIPSPKKES